RTERPTPPRRERRSPHEERGGRAGQAQHSWPTPFGGLDDVPADRTGGGQLSSTAGYWPASRAPVGKASKSGRVAPSTWPARHPAGTTGLVPHWRRLRLTAGRLIAGGAGRLW